MRIHIITIHHIHNFGSVFQAFCLQKFLTDRGYFVEILDYRPSYYRKGRNKIKSYLGRAINLMSYLKRKKKYDSFIKRNDILSKKRYRTLAELKADYECSKDVFVAGGDQIWNSFHPCGRDDAYKLTFANQGIKVACGTSLGRDNYKVSELAEISNKVSSFLAIMLREQTTVDLLSKYVNAPCFNVIDPVGLIDPRDLASFARKPSNNKSYAVMYLADSSPTLDLVINKLSKERMLDIVHVCGFKKKCYCDYFEKSTGPEELLGYIMNADFVISSSFHATLFSIIYNKQFAVILPEEGTNARIENLLKLFRLDDRIVRDEKNVGIVDCPIDFSEANEILREFRKQSVEKIDAILREIDND